MDARTTRGVLFALLAAVCFGLAAPVIGIVEDDLPPQTISALLAVGATLSVPISRAFGRNGPSFEFVYLPRLMLISLVGAVFAPMLLAYGLSRANGIAACLLLNLEAVFTSFFAVVLYREPIGWRFAFGITAITTGAIALTQGDTRPEELIGLLAVAAATLMWSLDSALSQPLARFDSSEVILRKGVMSAAYAIPFAFASGAVAGEHSRSMLLVVLCGVLAGGATERFYLLAQRLLGVARTGSIFSISPFFSAAVAFLSGAPFSPWWGLSGLLMGIGLWLHAVDFGAPARAPLALGEEDWQHELP